MRRAIQKHLRDFLAIIAIAVVAVLVGGYILSNQRFYAPSWVPLVGSDFVDYQAEMATAQAFTAGQGQTVMIAGVSVGEIGEVTLKDGRASITMKIKRKYTPIYKDATVLSRPNLRLFNLLRFSLLVLPILFVITIIILHFVLEPNLPRLFTLFGLLITNLIKSLINHKWLAKATEAKD